MAPTRRTDIDMTSFNLCDLDILSSKLLLLKKQLEVVQGNENTPPEIKGSIDAIMVGVVEVTRNSFDLSTEVKELWSQYNTETFRLREQIKKLRNQNKQ